MDDLRIHRFSYPIVTGTPPLSVSPSKPSADCPNDAPSFSQVLSRQVKEQADTLTFSKHAAARVSQRKIDVSGDNLARLQEGVRIAQQKGLDDTLILVDRTAFLVSVKNSTVITTVNGEELRGNVFTNIDGTVII